MVLANKKAPDHSEPTSIYHKIFCFFTERASGFSTLNQVVNADKGAIDVSAVCSRIEQALAYLHGKVAEGRSK